MAKSNIQPSASNLNIDPVLLAKAIEYSKANKRDINTLINISLQKILSGDIDDIDEPFYADETAKGKKVPFSEQVGCLEGLIWMSDDFDEPLECLKDYM